MYQYYKEGAQSLSFIGKFFLLYSIFGVSIIGGSTVHYDYSGTPGVDTEEFYENCHQPTVHSCSLCQLCPPSLPLLPTLTTSTSTSPDLAARRAGGVACDDEAEDGLGQEVLGDRGERGLSTESIHHQLEHIQRLNEREHYKYSTKNLPKFFFALWKISCYCIQTILLVSVATRYEAEMSRLRRMLGSAESEEPSAGRKLTRERETCTPIHGQYQFYLVSSIMAS